MGISLERICLYRHMCAHGLRQGYPFFLRRVVVGLAFDLAADSKFESSDRQWQCLPILGMNGKHSASWKTPLSSDSGCALLSGRPREDFLQTLFGQTSKNRASSTMRVYQNKSSMSTLQHPWMPAKILVVV